jgi:ubiquinone/menaquinone biosynthesis C-methylase UbiE
LCGCRAWPSPVVLPHLLRDPARISARFAFLGEHHPAGTLLRATEQGGFGVDELAADYKRAAIEQWTADPCGSSVAEGEPGTRPYFERLLDARERYAHWMKDELGYAETAGLRVLDVGCGQGIDLAHYARCGARATGIDLTPRHVELARAHLGALGLEAEVVQGDAEKQPFADDSFDRVSSNGVLHHTPDMSAALREIHRVLRPGGEARVIVYNRRSLHYVFNQVLFAGVLKGGLWRERSMAGVLSAGVEYSSVGARPLVRVYSPRQVQSMMRAAGFANVTTTVRHFWAEDAFPFALLEKRVARLRDPHFLDRIGRLAGWYVVARATVPA